MDLLADFTEVSDIANVPEYLLPPIKLRNRRLVLRLVDSDRQ